MQELDADILLAERVDSSVLISGERGAGTENVARLVHGGSRRSREPFVTIRCAGLPDALIESALFGHAPKSFSEAPSDTAGRLDQAHGGSLLIEDVGELSRQMQERLLRFLEARMLQHAGGPPRVIDVRIFATTTQNLFERVVERTFLEGLYYRLNVIYLSIPPLRDRREDIPSLITQVLGELSTRQRMTAPHIAPAAITSLQAYDWPGNMQELREVLESLLVTGQGAIVQPDDLPREIAQPQQTRD